MAETLKEGFGPEMIDLIAAQIARVRSDFDTLSFQQFCADGFDDLELTPRARRIAAGMARFLPEDRSEAIAILTETLDEWPERGDHPMASFVHLPAVYFVADHGLDHFDASMELQRELTRLFTAEFSIRAYLEQHEERTLAVLAEWAHDPDEDIRRLVSEGTRPRLPWAPRLKRFQQDPSPVLDLLEQLRDDQSEYVRRSVANNLNDIAKDHPDAVVETARRWMVDATEPRRRLIRHGLRTLIKQGHAGALDVLGFGHVSPLQVAAVTFHPETVQIGSKVSVAVELLNPSDQVATALVDLGVHFVKADGSARPKVFKGAELEVPPGEIRVIRKTISVAQQTTRTHYPGWHTMDVIVNGRSETVGGFELVAEA
ncbi:MAG: DNA alkylation repair protein [Actinomycetia bacterium]|nr:DNA alkylation repair protein [Actinomycetes bacterium]